MIDAKNLLDRFLGAGSTGQNPPPATRPGAAPSPWTDPTGSHHGAPSAGGLGGLADTARQALGGGGSGQGGGFGGLADAARQALGSGGHGGLAAGGAAGSLLGLVMGGKRKGRFNSTLSHGGAALLGALASRAFENWQARQPAAQAPVATPAEAERVAPRFLASAAPAGDGQPFELALVRAMIAAAKADGHVDAEEQRRIFGRVEELGLDAESKGFVFDALSQPLGVGEVAASATTPEQAAELYLAARLAVDPDQPAERAFLEALAHRLNLPDGLAEQLDRQADGVSA
ncbi:tellurite resistance TerB family protein [Roseomonas elaeocarpi]|uniref:Tellurite resistance TerB family protein n=1 Tax=Roseomonas elaeocarpi TaxID=907779 RepID=A0ABV6JRB0_9PROT